MSDLERYISNRKKRSQKFAENYESGYEAFEFSIMLRQAREKAGITQEAIAKKLRTEPVRNFVFVSHTSILEQEVAYGKETTNNRSSVIG